MGGHFSTMLHELLLRDALESTVLCEILPYMIFLFVSML
jgi:hypothetical protein